MRDVSLKDATYDLTKACEDAERALGKIEVPPWDNPAAKQDDEDEDIFDKYRPDQPRDDHGRWTEEGGGGRGSRTRGKKPTTTTGKPKKQPKKPTKPKQPKKPTKPTKPTKPKPPKKPKAPAKKPPAKKPKPEPVAERPKRPRKPRVPKEPETTVGELKPIDVPRSPSTALTVLERQEPRIPSGLELRDKQRLDTMYEQYDAAETELDGIGAKIEAAWDAVDYWARQARTSTGPRLDNYYSGKSLEARAEATRLTSRQESLKGRRDQLRSSITQLEARLRGEKRLVKRTAPGYVCRKLLNAGRFIAWAKSEGFDTTVVPSDMHVTIAYSRDAFPWPEGRHTKLVMKPSNNRTLERFGKAVVLRFDSAILDTRWNEFIDMGAKWEHDEYKPHVTISYKVPEDVDVSEIEPYSGELVFGPEEVKEFNDDVEHVEKLREVLGGVELRTALASFSKRARPRPYYRCTFTKADESLGLIFGWAIVSSVDGEPYYDTQGDHIPEDSMLNAAAEFMLSRRTMKIMHEGKKVGTVVFAWPMTDEIAGAMGVGGSKRTGLMVAVKPDNPNVIRRFQDRQYTGFSIGGNRLLDEEVD